MRLTKADSPKIVDRESGVLDLPNEHSCLSEGDHQSVCKFEDRQDTRYDHICGVLSDIISPLIRQRNATDMKKLRELLSIDETNPVDINSRLTENEDIKLNRRFKGKDGTCSWIEKKDWFLSWLKYNNGSTDQNDPRILWISGHPGTGKSYLATYIADLVSDQVGDGYCLYHRFFSSDHGQRSTSYLLRSLAFQAACQIHSFREELLQTALVPFGNMEAAPIWDKLFRGILFKNTLQNPLYWVIDGLDESDAVRGLSKCLATVEASFSVRILMLSRPAPEIRAMLDEIPTDNMTRKLHRADHSITVDDTHKDMKALVEERVGSMLPSVSRKGVVDRFLRKASGNFLWLSLTTKDVKKSSYATAGKIKKMLDQVPVEMTGYYMNMIHKTEEDEGYDGLVSTILTWATFSFRPLHINELNTAIRLEIPDLRSDFKNEELINCCGDFLQIGTSSTVELIHDTARQFLKDNSRNYLGGSHAQRHGYLASLCLQYLSSERKWNLPEPRRNDWRHRLSRLEKSLDERRISKNRDGLSSIISEDSLFLVYATQAWAYHLSLAEPGSKDLWVTMQTFFENDCLTWINTLALLGDLNTLIQSAQYLKAYIKRSEEWMASGNANLTVQSDQVEHMTKFKLWAADLIKIVGKFGGTLIESPTAIYKGVLPFCPTRSIIRKTYETSDPASLSVSGISFLEWDDCHSTLSVGSDATATKVYATDEVFAALVPQEHGLIVWHATTCEKLLHINHGDYVTKAAVNKKGDLVCTSGVNTIKIWKLSTGKELGCVDKQNDRVIALAFGANDQDLLVGYQNRLIVTHKWVEKTSSTFLAQADTAGALTISFSPDGSRVVLSSRFGKVELWDVPNQRFVRPFALQDEQSLTNEDAFNQAQVINWHPDSASLFLIYHNMRVEWWIPEYDRQKELKIRANMIVCSPCGNLLLASDYDGTIKVFSVPKVVSKGRSFGEVTLLYSLKCPESITDFAFSPNGHRFYEVRGTMCSVWAPVELVPADKADTEEDRPVWSEEHRDSGSSNAMVTAIAGAPGDEAFCYGKDDGSLTIQDMDSGENIRQLTGHSQDVTIIALTWSTSGNWIASADDSGQIFVRKILIPPKGSREKKKFFKPSSLRLSDGVNQLLFSPDDSYLLISTSSADYIWDTSAKRICKERPREASAQEKWIAHPKDPLKLVSIGAEAAHVYTWDEFAPPTVEATHDTQSGSGGGTIVEFETQKRDLRAIIFETLLDTGYGGRSPLVSPMVQLLQHVSKLLGRLRNRVMFFNKAHWLCTWEIGAKEYHMHLLLPNDWINPETLELSVLCASEALLCPWKGEVAIIKNWTQPRPARVVTFV